GCPHRRRRTDTCPNQYKTAGFGQLSPPLTGHPPQDSRETAQIAKKHPQGEPSPVHFFLRSPPHPLAEEGLFVVPQLLLGLWHLAGLLEVFHALGDVHRHPQAVTVHLSQEIKRGVAVPVYLLQISQSLGIVLLGP